MIAIRGFFRSLDIPVLRQEMRIRQRGGRSFGVMLGYVAILSIIALAILFAHDLSAAHFNAQQSASVEMSRTGHDIFAGLTLAQLVMVVLVVPAYSAGAVSMEREKASFDLLAITTLPTGSIITQKMAAALAQVIMLLVASVPVLSIVFLLGGVSPAEVCEAYAIILLTAMAVNALGVMCSCYFSYTRTATFTTYLATVLFLLGVPIASLIMESVTGHGYQNSSDGSALGITIAVAFAAGIVSIFFFGVIALILKKVTNHWRSRSYRMWIFGASYALVLLAFNIPSLCNEIINSIQINGMLAVLYINAFVAMFSVIDPYAAPNQSLVIALTMIFSAGCAYLFRNLAINRFNAIRRV